MGDKLDGDEFRAKSWLLPAAAVAICLLLVGFLIDWFAVGSPEPRSRFDSNDPAPLGAMAGPVSGVPGEDQMPGGSLRELDAGANLAEGTIELDFQRVAGQVDDPALRGDPSSEALGVQRTETNASPGAAVEEGVEAAAGSAREPLAPSGAGGPRDAGAPQVSDREARTADAGATPEQEQEQEPEPAEPEAVASEEPQPEPCGMTYCLAGLVCCNASCGTCVLPGMSCSQLSCTMPTYPFSVTCGRNTCSVGEVCCNPTCGICTAPGEACSDRICN